MVIELLELVALINSKVQTSRIFLNGGSEKLNRKISLLSITSNFRLLLVMLKLLYSQNDSQTNKSISNL